MAGRGGEHWAEYNDAQGGRDVRELCARVMALAGHGEGRVALDLGCGAGVETRALLADGWRVHAIDSAPGTRERVLMLGDHGAEAGAGGAGAEAGAGGARAEAVARDDAVAEVGTGTETRAGARAEAGAGGEAVARDDAEARAGAVARGEAVTRAEGGTQARAGTGAGAGPRDRLTVAVMDLAEVERLPGADLVYSGYSLQYIPPERFRRVWAAIRGGLRPGGLVAVNLLGDRDEWAGTPGETFLAEAEVRALFDGLEIVHFAEEDADGPAYGGPKHWHVFDVIARAPAQP